MQEIAGALKEEGLLERDAHFETMDQMLGGLEKTSESSSGTQPQHAADERGRVATGMGGAED